jgi:PTS system nitrogen regulatory IIA component
MASTLADYTAEEFIIERLGSSEPEGIVAELCSALSFTGRIGNASMIYDAVIAREKLNPTAMAPGWAIPHARLRGVSEVQFALGRTAVPVNWFGQCGVKVTTVFLCVLPEADSGCYLALISGFAKLSQDSMRISRLRTAASKEQTLEILREVSVRWPLPAACVK